MKEEEEGRLVSSTTLSLDRLMMKVVEEGWIWCKGCPSFLLSGVGWVVFDG